MCQVVPFCGVFLKELSDALDGTASIISLKAPLEHTDTDSLEVHTHTHAHTHTHTHTHTYIHTHTHYVTDL